MVSTCCKIKLINFILLFVFIVLEYPKNVNSDDSLAGLADTALIIELNPCEVYPKTSSTTNCTVTKQSYYFNKKRKICETVNIPACSGGDASSLGFPSLDSCEDECNKKRPARRLSNRNKYEVLSDLQITAPKKLSSSIKRKFPVSFCELQWDSGLICPHEHRGNYIDQFYYDGKTNSCLHFVYNGCGGNANRFFSLWECIQSCVRKSRKFSK